MRIGSRKVTSKRVSKFGHVLNNSEPSEGEVFNHGGNQGTRPKPSMPKFALPPAYEKDEENKK